MSMRKILVVEDEDPIRNNLARLLRIEKYDVVAAENGKVALAKVAEFKPDLIVSDMMMPELDGAGLITALRADPEMASIPFIFLTARADRSDFREGMRLGADDYVTKPFTRAEILEAIEARLKKADQVAAKYEAELTRTREELSYYMHHDAVTGLPNRLMLRELFEQAKASGKVGVLAFGVDRFAQLVAGRGGEFHDELLRAIASRLASTMPGVVPVHVLDDQFVLLSPGTGDEQTLIEMARELRDKMAVSLTLSGVTVLPTASIGIACWPSDGSDIDELAPLAQRALSVACQEGGNTERAISRIREQGLHERLMLESDLLRALERQEFELHYQPQVSLATGKVVGAEALVRWRHPERGLVSPALFLPLAEESGAIVPMGRWVLEAACDAAREWARLGFAHVRVGVNISGRQFKPESFVPMIRSVLSASGLPPSQLDLEVTESVTMQDIDTCAAMLRELRELGLTTSLDDFGTGYSSLTYLKRLPFHTLKIDQSFVRNSHVHPHNAAIVEAISQMGRQLGLQLIAEGVEAIEELNLVRAAGCHEMQGYYFSKPLPFNDFIALLVSGRILV